MKFTGDAVLSAPPEKAWDALLDPAVLVRTIPGCERLEATGENAYAMTVTAGVAAVRGTYTGTVELTDLDEPSSLLLKAAGAGAPGTVGADVKVRFTSADDGRTRVDYDADAVVGGMLGGVGQRMLTSVSRRMAGEFFSAVDAHLTGADAATESVSGTPGNGPTVPGEPRNGTPGVWTAPESGRANAPPDFVKGLLAGGALALAGVAVGALVGRRRG